MNILQRIFFRLKTGNDIVYAGNEDGWIRYKDIFIQVLKTDDGKYDLAWSEDAPNHIRIDEMHIAILFDKNKVDF